MRKNYFEASIYQNLETLFSVFQVSYDEITYMSQIWNEEREKMNFDETKIWLDEVSPNLEFKSQKLAVQN